MCDRDELEAAVNLHNEIFKTKENKSIGTEERLKNYYHNNADEFTLAFF